MIASTITPPPRYSTAFLWKDQFQEYGWEHRLDRQHYNTASTITPRYSTAFPMEGPFSGHLQIWGRINSIIHSISRIPSSAAFLWKDQPNSRNTTRWGVHRLQMARSLTTATLHSLLLIPSWEEQLRNRGRAYQNVPTQPTYSQHSASFYGFHPDRYSVVSKHTEA